MSLIPWQPNEVFDLRRDMNRLFDSFWGGGERGETDSARWYPAVDISESGDNVVVTAELPGTKAEDVKVTVSNDVLTIQGEKKRETKTEEGQVHRTERSYGSFMRSFHLPYAVNADKISAHHRDGILTVTVPKAEKAKTKQIEVKAN